MDPTLKIDYIKLKNQKLAVSIRINSSHPKLISSITILLLEEQKEEKKGKGKRKKQKGHWKSCGSNHTILRRSLVPYKVL